MHPSTSIPTTAKPRQEEAKRKRRAHAKSRKGCGNCKFRRVKCDETRPQCKTCISYNVSCSYDQTKAAALELNSQCSFQVDFSHKPNSRKPTKLASPISTNQHILSILNSNLEADSTGPWPGVGCWNYSEKDLETFQRFMNRTLMTIGTSEVVPVYRKHIGPIAFKYPFLMHMAISLTLMHDAYLSSENNVSSQYTQSSLQHWNTATVLFNTVLSRPIEDDSRDALWTTATLIGSNVFAYMESTSIEDTWPLKPDDAHDLDWIRLSNGKKAIWKLTNPTRPESIFYSATKKQSSSYMAALVYANDFSVLPEPLRLLLEIDPNCTPTTTATTPATSPTTPLSTDFSFPGLTGPQTMSPSSVRAQLSNPYHLPALMLCQLQSMTSTHDNLLSFLHFLGYMSDEFKALLELKEPRALLLFYWWFRCLEDSELWWLARRARVVGKAIRVWMERRLDAAGEMGIGSPEEREVWREIFDWMGRGGDKAGRGKESGVWGCHMDYDVEGLVWQIFTQDGCS